MRFYSIIMCLFFSSLMAIKNDRGSSYPFISGDTFRSICDYICDETQWDKTSRAPAGSIIFVKGDMVSKFINENVPKLKRPVILVIHNSDETMPGGHLLSVLSNPNIGHVFAQNLIGRYEKCTAIPIGLANRCWSHGNTDIFKQALYGPAEHRNKFLYLNIQIATYAGERSLVVNLFKDQPFCTYSPQPKSLQSYLSDLLQHEMVLCPRGNGPDTHRLWETLLMGAVPVVRRIGMEDLYDGLPVLVVDSWQSVNEAFLQENLQNIRSQKYDISRFFADYWLRRIRSAKALYQ